MDKLQQAYVERDRVRLPAHGPYTPAMMHLINTLQAEYRRKHSDLRIRVPSSLRAELIDEFEDNYRYSPFGDLSETYRKYAEENWALTIAKVPIELDPRLRSYMAIDALYPPTRKSGWQGTIVAKAEELQEV